MADYVTLMGADDVRQAGRNIAGAAEEMKRAAESFDATITRNQQFMDDWLDRFRQVLEDDFQRKARR